MGSDFWKFSCCAALQHLIPFWWFERRDDNRRWHDLEGKQKFSLQKQCKIKHEGEYGSCIIHPAALAKIAGLSWVRPKCCFFFSNRSSLLHLIILQVLHSRIHQSPDCIKEGHTDLWGKRLRLFPSTRCASACQHATQIRSLQIQKSRLSSSFLVCFTLWGYHCLLQIVTNSSEINILNPGEHHFMDAKVITVTRLHICY